jgi:phosphoglycolate phosphatase-like HAD superfamily hydrolase
MLILFDIDMTLISTSGSGMKAMADTGRELFGPTFNTNGVEFSGRLDPLIISDLLGRHQADNPEMHAAFRREYARHLGLRLRTAGIGKSLPGVQDLLAELRARADVVLGLLTGNFEETGTLKLRACGIDPAQFSVRVWGDESPVLPARREHLVPLGIARGSAVRRAPLRPRQVTIVGDTPHDVGCARTHGCRSLGVATGYFSVEQLCEAGAELVLSDLRETPRVMAWLTEPA